MNEASKGGPRVRPAAQPAVVFDARRLGRAMPPPAGEFSYAVIAAPAAMPPKRPAVSEPPRSAAPSDKRHASRQRTKLRTGSIIDGAGRLVTDCLVFDRSPTGSRLRLPAGITLMVRSFQFYDDLEATLLHADIVWRAEHEIGVRLRAAPATPQARALAESLRRRADAQPR